VTYLLRFYDELLLSDTELRESTHVDKYAYRLSVKEARETILTLVH
jgi:hypothetical protein